MDSLLFVHGTGVRREGFDATMKKLRSGLDRGGLAHVRLEGVNWGETLGANFTKEDIDAVLPPTRTRALLDEGDWEAALWLELMSDPLTEMRLASLRQNVTLNPAAPVLPGQPLATVDLDTKFARLKQTLADPLPGEVGGRLRVEPFSVTSLPEWDLIFTSGRADSLSKEDVERLAKESQTLPMGEGNLLRLAIAYAASSRNMVRVVRQVLKFADFELISRSRTLAGVVGSRNEFEIVSAELLKALFPMQKAVRLLGVSISGFKLDEIRRAEQIALGL
jgi:hypothetical protein